MNDTYYWLKRFEKAEVFLWPQLVVLYVYLN